MPRPERPENREVPRLEAPRLEAEAAPALEFPAEKPELEAPRPRGPALAQAVAAAPEPRPSVVRAAGFDGAPLQAKGPARDAKVNVGGFSGLTGAPGGASGADRKPEVRQGGFAGAQTERAAGKPARPAGLGGFGATVAASGGGTARTAAPAGFSQARAEKAEARPKREQAPPDVTPVQILSKPKPVYTAEARERRIEGEVALEVRFGADGRLQVLRVVRGLGHGLDEAAVRAVEAMQFRPARRNGEPMDAALAVSVAFRLAY